jgi:hypothetical protein
MRHTSITVIYHHMSLTVLYNILRKTVFLHFVLLVMDAQQPWCLYYLVLPVHSDKLFLARRNHLTRFMLTDRAVPMFRLLSGRRQYTTRACLTDTTILVLKTQQQWNCLEIFITDMSWHGRSEATLLSSNDSGKMIKGLKFKNETVYSLSAIQLVEKRS